MRVWITQFKIQIGAVLLGCHLEMSANFIQICAILIICIYQCKSISVGCPTNKIAPKLKAEGRTFGLLFGQRFQEQNQQNTPNDCYNKPVGSAGGDNQEPDYDPVSSNEDNDYQDNINTVVRPSRRPPSQYDFGGLLDWWPSSSNNRPPRPTHATPNWFWGWFNGFQNRPTRPTRPPYYEGVTIPVHEHIDEDEVNVTWRPGAVVGGPNNDIIGVTQDLSNWSTSPTPRPTRPYIPGQQFTSSRFENQGIIGSFIDLFLKK